MEFKNDDARIIYWGKIQDELVEQLKLWFIKQGDKGGSFCLKFFSDWSCPTDALPRYKYISESHDLIVFMGTNLFIQFRDICTSFVIDAYKTVNLFFNDPKWDLEVYLYESNMSSQFCYINKLLKK
jgi:hypothetical protein